MANTIVDLQAVLFAEIENIKQASLEVQANPHSTSFNTATRRAVAINETARTIISAGALVLQATVQASTALKNGHALDGTVISQLTGTQDENTNTSIELPTGK